MSVKTVAFHKWEELSLVAPYRLIALIDLPRKSLLEANPNAYNQAMSEKIKDAENLGVHVGTCDVCGTGITNNYVCRDSAGKNFVVGCECVKKVGDSVLCTEVEKAEKIRQRDKRREVAEEKRREAARQREIALQEQRERNGGLTDFEVVRRQEELQVEQRFAEARKSNAWLIDVLENVSGGFAADMVRSLSQQPLGSHSPRQVSVMRDMFGKFHGRRNSKKYEAAIDLFDEKSGALE